MKSSNDIIDALSKHFDGANDLSISRQTGIAQSVISMVRTGRRSLPPEDCVKAAAALGIEPGALFLIAAGERQKNSKLRSSCMRMAKAALPVIAAVGLNVAPVPPAQASAAPHIPGTVYYVKSRRRTARTGKPPVYTGTYPTARRGHRPTLLLPAPSAPCPPTTTT